VTVPFGEVWQPDTSADLVVIHDPSYPLVPVALLREVIDTLAANPDIDGVVPVCPVTDTLKRVGAGDTVLGTVDRGAFHLVGSPQAYPRAVLERIRAPGRGTLPARPAELAARAVAAGARLHVVVTSAENLTTVEAGGLGLAEALMGSLTRRR
jgi:2-C-methyl-D-erythritol 4-phosphate cytidylyltransferase/2-C-methyl-D-erythritol 2,4-cyclodiphosphate synthase